MDKDVIISALNQIFSNSVLDSNQGSYQLDQTLVEIKGTLY